MHAAAKRAIAPACKSLRQNATPRLWAAAAGARPQRPGSLAFRQASFGTQAAASTSPHAPPTRPAISSTAPRLRLDAQGPAGRAVTVTWPSGTLQFQDHDSGASAAYTAAALRDVCPCQQCRDPSSGQKTFATTEIPLDIGIANVQEVADGLVVEHDRDLRGGAGHQTILPWAYVRSILGQLEGGNTTTTTNINADEYRTPSRASLRRRVGVQHWDRATLVQHTRKVDYEAFMGDDAARWDVVSDVARLGIAFLENVPRDPDAVVRLTTRIANIRETFYGRTFDVRAKPDAENVAYTSGYLGLHQDLLYLDPTPMVQVLHCVDNSCAGGESLFSDGDRVGRILWAMRREHRILGELASQAIPYGYSKHGHKYWQSRPVLAPGATAARAEGQYGNIYWSPPFQYTPSAPQARADAWIRGARVLERLLNADEAVYAYKMAPGECVLFDNIRVLHGRNAFDAEAGGSRWLRGAYIAPEDFLSVASYMPATHVLPEGKAWDPEACERELLSSAWYEEAREMVRRMEEE
jgi:gamma-butyrobetaine dioxygenase